MNGLELKKVLYENPQMIESVLESIQCEFIHVGDSEITSTRPGGDNKKSVHIRLSELLPCRCYTAPEFENNFEKRDFIELIQFFTGFTMINAMKYICHTCNIDQNIQFEKQEVSESMLFLKQYKKATSNKIDVTDGILEESTLDDYIYSPIHEFYKDGINPFVQMEFGVCYDIFDNRAVFPIRNKTGGLISVKGRTLFEDYKRLDIPKYMYYHNYTGANYLYGEYENSEYLKSADKIYVFESEKGVMQAASFGYRNCVATSKKTISKQQLIRLLSYGKQIVICYDKGVNINEIKSECYKFKNLVDVYYINDVDNILKDKESPVDKGIKVFELLIKKYAFKYVR